MTPFFVHTLINEDWPCGKKRFLDPKWLAYRVEIFLRYTLPSLEQQTCQNFWIWMDCRPGSEKELEPHRQRLEAAGVLITFDRGRQHLTSLPGHPPFIYLLRIDSDDCYAPEAVLHVKQMQGDMLASQFYQGYIWMVGPRILYRMAHPSPPFYCLRLAIGEEGILWPTIQGHDSVHGLFHPVELPAGQFCMLRHQHHSGGAPLRRPDPTSILPEGSPAWREAMQRFPMLLA